MSEETTLTFKQKKKLFIRALSLKVIPHVGAFLIRFIGLTNKKIFHTPSIIPTEPVVFAFWHSDLLMQSYNYAKFRKIPKARVLISEHFDGEIIASIMTIFNLGTIRGSSTRGGARVLINAIKELKEGNDIGITPDGPKGPRYEVSDGVIVMAQKTKAKVVIYSVCPSKYWQLKSWDKFVIPKPFSHIDFYASEPIDIVDMEFEEARGLIKEKLMLHAMD
jgi:lysophospholipid acyltransferase (LPLAT)-like uncharacterized protein